MSAPQIILDGLPSLCQKLSDLVEVWRIYNKNNFDCFLLRHGVYTGIIITHTNDMINLHIRHMDDSWYTRSWSDDYHSQRQFVFVHSNSNIILQTLIHRNFYIKWFSLNELVVAWCHTVQASFLTENNCRNANFRARCTYNVVKKLTWMLLHKNYKGQYFKKIQDIRKHYIIWRKWDSLIKSIVSNCFGKQLYQVVLSLLSDRTLTMNVSWHFCCHQRVISSILMCVVRRPKSTMDTQTLALTQKSR